MKENGIKWLRQVLDMPTERLPPCMLLFEKDNSWKMVRDGQPMIQIKIMEALAA